MSDEPNCSSCLDSGTVYFAAEGRYANCPACHKGRSRDRPHTPMTDELEWAPETIWMQPATKDKSCFISYLDKPDHVGPFVAYTRKDIAVAAVEVAIEALTKREERITEIEEAIGAALDDIPTTDGFCDWADVANARDQILNHLKANTTT